MDVEVLQSFFARLASPYLRWNDECEIKTLHPWFLLAMVLAFVTMSTIQIVHQIGANARTAVRRQRLLLELVRRCSRISTGMLQMTLALAAAHENDPSIGNKGSIGTGLDDDEVRMLNRIEALRIDSVLPVILEATVTITPPSVCRPLWTTRSTSGG